MVLCDRDTQVDEVLDPSLAPSWQGSSSSSVVLRAHHPADRSRHPAIVVQSQQLSAVEPRRALRDHKPRLGPAAPRRPPWSVSSTIPGSMPSHPCADVLDEGGRKPGALVLYEWGDGAVWAAGLGEVLYEAWRDDGGGHGFYRAGAGDDDGILETGPWAGFGRGRSTRICGGDDVG